MSQMTWEQAVAWLRQQPDQQELVRASYFDDPLLDAARRFAGSAEWRATRKLLGKAGGRALDLGAGRGISSYALAGDGWQVTAVEPDPSPLVGADAIRELARQSGQLIQVVQEYGESLPFEDDSFDLVYSRQVLHHARDLERFSQEAARVLKSGGVFLAAREHVIKNANELEAFLNSHPLHKCYGGEYAYPLEQYVAVLGQAGLRLLKIMSPLDSPINAYPEEPGAGLSLRRRLIVLRGWLGRRLPRRLAERLSKTMQAPGRLYSFWAAKPLQGGVKAFYPAHP